MDDLIAFLGARLDERGEQAPTVHSRACATLDDTFWGTSDSCDCDEPAFVLADVAAKRQIIEQCIQVKSVPNSGFASDVAKEAVRLLALPYASHPNYRAEWTPQYS